MTSADLPGAALPNARRDEGEAIPLLTLDQVHRMRLHVAEGMADAADGRELLEALGLLPEQTTDPFRYEQEVSPC